MLPETYSISFDTVREIAYPPQDLLIMRVIALTLASLIFLVQPLAAQDKANSKVTDEVLPRGEVAYVATVPKPKLTEIRYGNHERNILDFWKAESSTRTPLAFVIHGGGWQSGEKERVDRFVDVNALLKAGISVTAINYRFIKMAENEGIRPPVKIPLQDAVRALQFVRNKAVEWNIDKNRIGAAGGSAGACSSLWIVVFVFPDSSLRVNA